MYHASPKQFLSCHFGAEHCKTMFAQAIDCSSLGQGPKPQISGVPQFV